MDEKRTLIEEDSVKTYMTTLLEQVADHRARIDIAKEIQQHIEEQAGANEAEGMEREEALEAAVADMGDPVETGVELNRIHRPKMAWGMFLGILLLLVIDTVIKIDFAPETFYESGGFFRLIIGIVLMLVINFWDYSMLGKYSREISIGLVVFIAIVSMFTDSFIPGRYIQIGNLTFATQYLIMLLVPLYGGVIYTYRNQELMGVVRCALWALLPGVFFVTLTNLYAVSLLMIVMNLIVLCVALAQHWFNVSAKKGILAISLLFITMIGIIAVVCLNTNGFRRDMLLAWLNPNEYRMTSGFFLSNVRELVSNSVLFGSASMDNTTAYEVVVGWLGKEYLLIYLLANYGILTAFFVVAVVLYWLAANYRMVWHQKNVLGRLMGTACCAVMTVQIVSYILANTGLLFSNYIGFPILNYSFTGNILNYVVWGILLSIYRYQKVLPVDGPNVVEHKLWHIPDDFLIKWIDKIFGLSDDFDELEEWEEVEEQNK